MVLNKNIILNKFDNNGFVILPLFDKRKLKNLQKNLSILINNSYKKNKIKFNHNINSINETINMGMINLEKENHKYLSEIYDIMSKSTDFLNLLMNEKILNIVKILLGLPKNKNLLINSTTIRMDTPGISKYTYGWHKDENTNIPGSNFVQLWAPLFNKVSKSNGALEVALKSHLSNVRTNKTYSEKEKLGKDNRSSYNNTFIIKDKFKKKIFNYEYWRGAFFKKNLIHRSGLTKNKSMRYACTCFYHNINDEKFRYYKIDRK